MTPPPFARVSTLPLDDAAARWQPALACCDTDRPAPAAERAPRRTRLHELPSVIHCSVIGTCLGTAGLRKLVARHSSIDREQASDLEIHHAAVELAGQAGSGSKALHKQLDEQHAAALKRFAPAREASELSRLWKQAVQSGEVPGAYWAALTHPQATPTLRQEVFGDVHMLSHLVGAANRADIQRLVALQHDNELLRDKVDRQQARLREIAVERDQTVRQLNTQLAALMAQHQPYASPDTASLRAEVYVLSQALHTKEQQVALHSSRRDEAEQSVVSLRTVLQEKQHQLDKSHELQQQLAGELHAIESAYMAVLSAEDDARSAIADAVRGRRLVYVGGRPGSNAALRELVTAAGGELIVHDGGVEDRKGLLNAALQRADLVLFPVDCVDHDSIATLKRLCGRLGTPYKPLRTASVSSFAAGVLASDAAAPPRLVSRFCLRHG